MSGNGNHEKFNISGLDSGCLKNTFHALCSFWNTFLFVAVSCSEDHVKDMLSIYCLYIPYTSFFCLIIQTVSSHFS